MDINIKDLLKSFNEPIFIKTLDGEEHHDIDMVVVNPTAYPLDIHSYIGWGKEVIGGSFVRDNVQKVVYKEQEVNVPNVRLDGLIALAHCVFEKGVITKHDNILLSKMTDRDWGKIHFEACIMDWDMTFEAMEKFIRKAKKFPINVPWWILLLGVAETGTWGKLWGARYILKDRILSMPFVAWMGRGKRPKSKGCQPTC